MNQGLINRSFDSYVWIVLYIGIVKPSREWFSSILIKSLLFCVLNWVQMPLMDSIIFKKWWLLWKTNLIIWKAYTNAHTFNVITDIASLRSLLNILTSLNHQRRSLKAFSVYNISGFWPVLIVYIWSAAVLCNIEGFSVLPCIRMFLITCVCKYSFNLRTSRSNVLRAPVCMQKNVKQVHMIYYYEWRSMRTSSTHPFSRV